MSRATLYKMTADFARGTGEVFPGFECWWESVCEREPSRLRHCSLNLCSNFPSNAAVLLPYFFGVRLPRLSEIRHCLQWLGAFR